MSKSKATAPAIEKEKEFAPFLVLKNLLGMFGYSREPSRGLRKKIDNWEKSINEALSEVAEDHQRVIAFYALDELKEGQEIPKEALDKLNDVYKNKSKVSPKDSRFLSEKEFDQCFPYGDNVLSRGDRKMLEYWVMIEEKEVTGE